MAVIAQVKQFSSFFGQEVPLILELSGLHSRRDVLFIVLSGKSKLTQFP